MRKSIGLPLLVAIIICFGSVASGTAQSDFSEVRELYNQGKKEQNAENYYMAIELYKTALESSPAYIEPIIGLAESYFMLGEFEEAIKWCTLGEKYARSNIHLKVLHGRTLAGLGQYEEAEAYLNEVLRIEPYNYDARFAMAELEIARGRILQAQSWYEKALKLSPRNRRALLSLALVYESKEQLGRAEELIKIALHYYPSSHMVQYLAGKHYFTRGDIQRAETHAQKALALKQGFEDATLLLSAIYLKRQKYLEASRIIEDLLSKHRDNHILWYTLGVAKRELGKTSESINDLSQVFRIRPDDELSRIALEDIIIHDTEVPESIRKRYAAYHFELGRQFQNRNYYEKALFEYRRGLRLDPDSVQGRLNYAEIFKAYGYYDRYLAELKALSSEGVEKTAVEDELEIYSSLLTDTVADRWNIRQYPEPLNDQTAGEPEDRLLDQSGNRFNILLFYDPDKSLVDHPESEEVVAEYFRFHLGYLDKVLIEERASRFTHFAGAFRKTRSSEGDYFLVFYFQDRERAFQATCDVYHGNTGGKLTTLQVVRTGNNKVLDAIGRLARSINDKLMTRGNLLDKRFDRGLINLGKRNGIEKEMTFAILESGAVSLNKGDIGITYSQEDRLGTFTVTETDELVSEGTIESDLFFDLINPGDQVVFPPPEEEEDGAEAEEEPTTEEEEISSEAGTRDLNLYRDILQIQ